MTEIYQLNVWDSLNLSEVEPWRRLFGNANVGMLNLCNLQVSGMVTTRPESFAIVQRWYARTNYEPGETTTRSWNRFLQSTYFELRLGDGVRWIMPLVELIDRRPRADRDERDVIERIDPWPEVVPPRQNVTVQMNSFDSRALEAIANDVGFAIGRNRAMDWAEFPRIWIHLEGVQVTSETTAQKVLRAIADRAAERRSVEATIANWILGKSREASMQDAAVMNVIRDAILEGRTR